MPDSPVLIDNQQAKMADYLREHLRDADRFRLVSAYFSIYGYDALAETLNPAKQDTRFLLGAPESAEAITDGDKHPQTFQLTESGLARCDAPAEQSQLARRCADWIKNIQIRSISKSNFLHGKMYHMESEKTGAATVGSSNFTRNGLGAAQNPNMEINVAVSAPQQLTQIADWFDGVWNDKTLTEDAKERVLTALARLYEENAPQFIYYKTLYELFRDDLDKRGTDKLAEYDKNKEWLALWGKLYEFQKDAAKTVIERLERHDGCILADSVGLGKTFTALAVIKHYLLRNKDVLVLSPKKLEENWRRYQITARHADNQLADAKLDYDLLAHTDLTRTSGKNGNIDLSTFNWDGYDLLVIDESHNFRNETKSGTDAEGNPRKGRYQQLMDKVIKGGKKTRVLMLSATPVNTSLMDLRNQINLVTAGERDAFQQTLGVANTDALLSAAQKKFQEWAKGKGEKDELLAKLGGDFMHLLSNLTVSRSRRQIKKFYKDFIKREGDFPAREVKNEYPHTDTKEELSYDALNAELTKLSFQIYRPSHYVMEGSDAKKQLTDEKERLHINQATREKFLVAMLRINFLKRLESSAHSLRLTLERTIKKIEIQIERIDKFMLMQDAMKSEDATQQAQQADDLPDADDEDEDFIVNRRSANSYHLRDLALGEWRADIQQDKVALQDILSRITPINPARDNKLQTLKQHLREKSKEANRKILLFTAFKDTAQYLYDNLGDLAQELNINMALVAGDGGRVMDGGGGDFNAILTRFSPRSRGGTPREGKQGEEEIDLLLATDCISEGQNLQDCDMVLNYDIHWNPVRLIQRFGRIDRIGSINKKVRMLNYWPTENMEIYLNLEVRVRARMALADATASGDDDILAEEVSREATQGELGFRDNELLKSLNNGNMPDLEENAITLGDLTLDEYLTQILRYVDANKAELEAAPNGIYAVVKDAAPGAIFFFRHKKKKEEEKEKENSIKNPTHPCYFVHIGKNGITHGYQQPRRILAHFESLAANEPKPNQPLCDAFHRAQETEEGKAHINNMAKEALQHIRDAYKKTAAGMLGVGTGGGRDYAHPSNDDMPTSQNLELITWLVIRND